MTAPLDVLRRAGEISALDEAMARSLSRLGGESRPEVLLATALVSRRVGQGDVCLDLPREVDAGAPAGAPEHAWPPLEAWLGALRDSPLVASARVGPATGPTGVSPLVLDERGRLYLRRCFEDERRVAERFLELARAPVAPFDPSQTAASLARILPTTGDPGLETDWPRVAAAVALSRRLCVISGGPGTGKTTTAARLLGVLVEQARAAGEAVPRIVLAAPTGKAAARLSAAIAQTCDEIQCDDGVRDAIPREASTLHRLLGIGRERHGASALRLRVDVVLVDEASMIDLALMARLVSALSPQARLILLGDSDQLASVEAGSVFADLCGPERTPGYAEGTAQRLRELTQGPVPAHSPDFSNFSDGSDGSDLTAPVGDCVVVLRRSHRYREQSGIGALARAIRLGDPDAALSVLRDEAFPDVTRVEPTQERGLGPSLREQVLAGYGPCFGDEVPTDPVEQLRLLDRFRVLCAVREGPAGLRSMNPRIDAALVGKGLLTDPGRLLAVDGAQALAPRLRAGRSW